MDCVHRYNIGTPSGLWLAPYFLNVDKMHQKNCSAVTNGESPKLLFPLKNPEGMKYQNRGQRPRK
jgi:hypothetical protein